MQGIDYANGPLTVVSNRAPYQLKKKSGKLYYERNVGGLVSVLDEVMRQSGGTWVAWGDGAGQGDRVDVPQNVPRYSMRLVRLSEQEVRNYYQGFSNRVLWPLSHYFLERCHFRAEYWKAYQRVNEKFARVLLADSGGPKRIWVHDFHLTLLPRLLREKHQDLSIGYFWHIPFPSSPVFRVLPWCREILSGLLGCDLIGFQLRLHAENFLDAVEQVFDFPVDRERFLVKVGKRNVKVGHFPVGIDFSKWEEIGVSSTNLERVGEIRKELGAEKIILGVDRLDYTKGIKERLLAYEHFLEKYPDYHGRVCMFQIAVPSRTRVEEYRILRREIDEAVGRISGRFSSRGWAPVRYLYKTLPVEELVNYYSAADVAMVTPLRDGMNLVAEEYVACRTREDGCLILSEFAGASEILSDAIVVNPYNIDEISESLHNALSMGEAAKRLRMQQLRKAARENDVYRWCQSFMVSLIKTEKTVSSR